MRKAVLTTAATAISAGFAMGAAHASASPVSFTSSTAMSASEEGESRSRAASALDGVMKRFIRVEVEQSATAADPDAKECPEAKDETRVAEADKSKKDEEKQPQGPEPIYFAF